ncbi:MAG: AAA family ATPase [Thermoplasmata archaeon]
MSFERIKGRIIKYPKKLSFDYVPDHLPNREEQIDKLFTLFRRVIESGVSQNAFLYGGVGTGKTATAKRFCMDYREWGENKGQRIDYVFINCRKRSNKHLAVWKIVSYFDSNFPDRGFSVGEMLEILKKHLKNKKTHLFVVLDEVDTLVQREGSDLIYLLSRFEDEESRPEGRLSLLLISQKNVLELLEKSALSTFKRGNRVKFPPYERDELLEILSYRSELALFPDTLGEGELKLLATTAASERGDARFGIELLERSALTAEGKRKETIGAEDIRAAKADIDPYFTEEKVCELNTQEKLVLLSAVRLLKSAPFTTTGDVEECYALICEEFGHNKLGHTQFWKYLKSISNHGLLNANTVSSSKGRTTEVSLSDIPAGVLEERLIDMLSG